MEEGLRPPPHTHTHIQRTERRHKVTWAGQWGCTHCPLTGSRLSRHGCLGTHPTRGRRFCSKRPSRGPAKLWQKQGPLDNGVGLLEPALLPSRSALFFGREWPRQAAKVRSRGKAPQAKTRLGQSRPGQGLHRFGRQAAPAHQLPNLGGEEVEPQIRTRVRPPGHLTDNPAKRPRAA